MIGEGVEKMRVADPWMQNPYAERRRARHSTASLKWIFLHPTTGLRGASQRHLSGKRVNQDFDFADESVGVFLWRMRPLVILLAALLLSVAASAQNCPMSDARGPAEASAASTLHGTLILHDELRKWLGLKLDLPTCGQDEIQLVFPDAKALRSAESFRGCAVSATGKLFDTPTGYYSAEIAISDPLLKPDSSCHPLPVEPDPSAAPIPTGLKSFRASITVDYRGKGHVEVRVWRSTNNAVLKPWQSFVHYGLTGGEDVMWFGCRKGFSIKGMTQTPKSPDRFIGGDGDSQSTVLQDMQGVNKVEFACEKKPESASSKKDSAPYRTNEANVRFRR